MGYGLVLLLATLASGKPYPAKMPQDIIRDGCAISSDANGHWPLHIWADVVGVPAGKYCEDLQHSWCDLYSMQPTLEKAQKDCAKFLKDMRKALTKAGRK